MNKRINIMGAALFLAASLVHAQNTAPKSEDLANFKKLAAQTVVHAEASLRKIAKAGPLADPAAMRREIDLPAKELQKSWGAFRLSDRVMFEYSPCINLLGELPVYASEARTPPKYHMGELAQQKLRYLKEDLAVCRKLRTTTPSFSS